MFGTWHSTRTARSLTDSSPAASDSRTHSRLGSASARPTAADRCRSASLEVTESNTRGVSHCLRNYASTTRRTIPRAGEPLLTAVARSTSRTGLRERLPAGRPAAGSRTSFPRANGDAEQRRVGPRRRNLRIERNGRACQALRPRPVSPADEFRAANAVHARPLARSAKRRVEIARRPKRRSPSGSRVCPPSQMPHARAGGR